MANQKLPWVDKQKVARLNTLTTIVMDMSQWELKTTLLMILNGADPAYAIDTATNPRERELAQ